MLADLLPKLGWVLLGSNVLALPAPSGLSENYNILDPANEAWNFQRPDDLLEGSLSLHEGRLNRKRPLDQNSPHRVQPSQELLALEAEIRSSIQNGQKGLRHNREESTSNSDKRQRIPGGSPEGIWRSNLHPAAPSTHEPDEWFFSTPTMESECATSPLGQWIPNIHELHRPNTILENLTEASRPLSDLGPLYYDQGEVTHQPLLEQPPTPQLSDFHLLSPPWHDTSHFAGVDQFGQGNHFPLPSESNSNIISPPTYHSGSSSRHPDAFSPTWPSNMESFNLPQHLHFPEQWSASHQSLQPASESAAGAGTHVLHPSHAIDHLIDEDHFMSQLLAAFSPPLEGRKQNDPLSANPHAKHSIKNHSPTDHFSSELSNPIHTKGNHVDNGIVFNSWAPVLASNGNQPETHCKPNPMISYKLSLERGGSSDSISCHLNSASITNLGSRVSIPSHAAAGREDHIDEDRFVSQLLVDYDDSHNGNEKKESDKLRSNSLEPLTNRAGDRKDLHSSVTATSALMMVMTRQTDSCWKPMTHHDQNENNAAKLVTQEAREDDRIQKLIMPQRLIPMEVLMTHLTKASYPARSMNAEFLRRFTTKFDLKIREHFRKHKTAPIKYEEQKMNGYPAIMCPVPDQKNLSIIRVIERSFGHNVERSQGLSHFFRELVMWLVYINTAILRKTAGDGGSNWESETNSHDRLTDWLANEAFHPSGASFPILGVVENDKFPKDGKAFGRVQSVLLDYFSQVSSIETSLKTSISMILLQSNRNIKQELSSTYVLGDGDLDLVPTIEAIILEYTASRMKPDTPERRWILSQPVYKPAIQLGNLQVPSLDKFPPSLTPGKMIRKKAIDGLPVILQLHPNKRDYIVRIRHQDKSTIPKDIMVIRINFLLHHLQLCHRQLTNYLVSIKIKPIDGAREAFSEWLSKVLLSPEDGKYPVFGKVTVVEDSPRISDMENFNDLQIQVIDYLSDKKPSALVYRLSLALLGFWYKHQPVDYLTSYFESDTKYWKTMITLLSKETKNDLVK
ncbi:hypothetical protein PSHT_04380 [Puccinia striiformis]|uniref:Uncharacterized protein n=1 Tax=Puccinia striiformis TaxID=27350 RepID=A0A2S4WD54_9BASI|nr:hypothetical protein PSHT_04380 [Puccinia striiformis]